MTEVATEDALVGLIALGAMAWVLWILVRAVSGGRLPIGKGYIHRDERPGAFAALFALYVAAASAMAYIGFDLLIGSAR